MNKLHIDKYLTELYGNGINKAQADKIQYNPMSDEDIQEYFPNAKIMNISELQPYNDIDSLLPNDIDYVVLLYRQSENYGHWCLLSKYDNTVEFFDPYGLLPDDQLHWVKASKRQMLGEKPYVSQLLRSARRFGYNIDYNSMDFQNDNNSAISTCGRHCCFRLQTIMDSEMNIDNYTKMMMAIKKDTGYTFDEIVADLIHK